MSVYSCPHHAGTDLIAALPFLDRLPNPPGDTRCKVWSVASGSVVHDIAWDSGGVNLCGFLPQAPSPASPAGAGSGKGGGSLRGTAGATKPQRAAAAEAAGALLQGAQQQPGAPLLLTAHIEPQRREGRILLWDVGSGEVETPTAAATASAAAAAPAGSPTSPAEASSGSGGDSSGSGSGSDAAGPRAPASTTASAAGSAPAAAAPGAAGELPAAGISRGVRESQQGLPAAASAPAQGRPSQRRAGWVDGQIHAPAQAIDGFQGKITSWDACLGPDGALLLATACGDGLARVFDLSSGAGPAKLFELSMEGGGVGGAAARRQDLPAWSLESAQQAANSRNLVSHAVAHERVHARCMH